MATGMMTRKARRGFAASCIAFLHDSRLNYCLVLFYLVTSLAGDADHAVYTFTVRSRRAILVRNKAVVCDPSFTSSMTNTPKLPDPVSLINLVTETIHQSAVRLRLA
jgi:hypothetical protein